MWLWKPHNYGRRKKARLTWGQTRENLCRESFLYKNHQSHETYSLSWEQHMKDLCPWFNYLPSMTHGNCGSNNSRWDLGTQPNHIILPLAPPKIMSSHFKINHCLPNSPATSPLISALTQKSTVQSLIWDKARPFFLWACKIKNKFVTSKIQCKYQNWVNAPIPNGRNRPKQRHYRHHESLKPSRTVIKS